MAGPVGVALRGFGKALLNKMTGKKNLSFSEKIKMQDKGVIQKKTGRLHPAHEDFFKGASASDIKKMTKTGLNPKLETPKPGKFLSQSQINKNKKNTKFEARYFKRRKFK